MMPKRITAVYVRVSSRSQSEASQLPDLERWIAGNLDVLRGDTEIKHYKDVFTGKTMERPGMTKMLADVNLGKIERIVIWRLDRLGRTASGLTKLFDDLIARKIGLVSLKDGLDLTTPAGKLMANVLASVAAYETEIRAERTLAGLEVAKSKGVKLGRRIVGEGNGKAIKVSTEQAEQVRRLKAEGAAIVAIGRAVGLSRPTVYKILGK